MKRAQWDRYTRAAQAESSPPFKEALSNWVREEVTFVEKRGVPRGEEGKEEEVEEVEDMEEMAADKNALGFKFMPVYFCTKPNTVSK